MADERTYEMESILALLNTRYYNDVWYEIFQKFPILFCDCQRATIVTCQACTCL